MHGPYCFGHDKFRAIMLLRRPQGLISTHAEFEHLMAHFQGSDVPFYAIGQEGRDIRFKIRSADDLPRATLRRLGRKCLDHTTALEVTLDLTCEDCAPPTESFKDGPYWSYLAAGVCALGVERWFDDLVFAANLALPGSASYGGGIVKRRNEVVGSFNGSFPGALYGARSASEELGWPPLHLLGFSETLIWLRAQDGFLNREGGGPTGRAINALTHIFSGNNSDAVELLWALIGLEALYTNSRAALLEQLRERSRLLLGDTTPAAKLVSSMYDIRSRFVHGDLDFVGEHPMRDTPEGFATPANENVRRANRVATSMLVASIQELIRRNWRGVQFSTTCSPTSGAQQAK